MFIALIFGNYGFGLAERLEGGWNSEPSEGSRTLRVLLDIQVMVVFDSLRNDHFAPVIYELFTLGLKMCKENISLDFRFNFKF